MVAIIIAIKYLKFITTSSLLSLFITYFHNPLNNAEPNFLKKMIMTKNDPKFNNVDKKYPVSDCILKISLNTTTCPLDEIGRISVIP